MFTKIILFAVLAACGVPSTPSITEPPAELPDQLPPGDTKPLVQHFCCQSVDHKTWSGDGCVTIGANQIDACTNVLYCPDKWTKEEGKVFCDDD